MRRLAPVGPGVGAVSMAKIAASVAAELTAGIRAREVVVKESRVAGLGIGAVGVAKAVASIFAEPAAGFRARGASA